MPWLRMPDGSAMHVKMARQRTPRCARGKPRTRECDYPVLKLRGPRGGVLKKPTKGTCDEPICDDCTYEPKPGVDLCSPHAYKYKARKDGPSP